MTKAKEITGANFIEETMMYFRTLKIECAAIASSAATGNSIIDASFRKLGARGWELMRQTIGPDMDALDEQLEAIVENNDGNVEVAAQTQGYKDIQKAQNKLGKIKGTLEYDVIEVGHIRPDGTDISSAFPKFKQIGFGGKAYGCDPYDSLLRLSDEGIVKLLKPNEHGK